ncbi:MAG TPA: O-antigen ligase family protein [Acidimicrobiales bacterium]|nr:O-antigen ligase family protein [Acidimicrobiales bacterium]
MSPPRCALADTAPGAAGRRAADPGLLAVLAAALLPIAYSTELEHPFWAPKAALCLLLLGPGAVAVARLVAAGDGAAMAATAFVAAAGLSAALSDKPALALVGGANWGTGLLFDATLVGAWALGRLCTGHRRRQLVTAVLAAALVNAAVGWLQARDLVPDVLESPGRSAGLMGNPVHLGALAAAAIVLAGSRLREDRRWYLWVGALALLAGAAQLSGGRSAVGLGLVATAVVAWRAGPRRGAAAVAAVVAGALVASVWAGGKAVTGSSRAVGQESTAQVGERIDLWRLSVGAIGRRPLLGWGPDRFEAATTPRYVPPVTEGGRQIYRDAHNWVVEYATTTGLVGLGLLVAWLALAARDARGPLAAVAAVAGVFLLFEPLSVSLCPLALLALGASTRGPPLPAAGPAWRAAAVAGLLVGAGFAVVLLAGEVRLRQATLDISRDRYRQAAPLLPAWPDVSLAGARVEAYFGLHDEAARRATLELARQATRRDPASSQAWAYLGQLERVWGSEQRARAALDAALRRDPWLAEALERRASLARSGGEDGVLADVCGRLKTLGRTTPSCR